jgi:molecular chaperone GrpE
MSDDTNDDLAEKLKQAEAEAAQKDADDHAELEGQESADGDLENLKAELEKMTILAQRTMADFQNYKRRQEEEYGQMVSRANASLITSLLPIVDNLDRAIEHKPAEPAEWVQGIEISTNQLHKTLQEAGVEPIEPLNQPFDPDLHQALVQSPGPENTVVEVLEKGYKIGNRVIRHAKVKVGNGEEA